MAKQIQLQLFGSGFGHLTLVLRSGLSVIIVKLKDILWRDRIGTSLCGLIGISNKNRALRGNKHEEVEQIEEVEDANISVESAIKIVETLENSESENDIFETALDEEDEDFDILLEEYNKEFNKVLDRRLMSMIDESTTFLTK